MTVTLPFDLFFSLAPYLSVKPLLVLARTQQALTEPLTTVALKRALTIPTSGDPNPITYAIKHDNMPLLTRSFATLEHLYPQGWQWTGLYRAGALAIFDLAAANSLAALQFLSHKHPLLPASWIGNVSPASLEYGLYASATGDSRFSASLASVLNRGLVETALNEGKYDCAAYLLVNHTPPLFPDGFRIIGDATYFGSGITLEFLLAHNAILPQHPLHLAVTSGGISDPRIIDILLQNGCRIDDTRGSHSPVFTPLTLACELFQPNSVRNLLRAGARVNGIDNTLGIKKLSTIHGFQYFCPNPATTLVLSASVSNHSSTMVLPYLLTF
ncbi:hypothetical protein F5Y08DRAFT_164430 [Xylaria arbuscula]|nr:hypothetical protein F5Y08DRAFT_164430 [Xylaria arbuscula]